MESKKKVNYSNALIYKICCLDTSIKQVYIGSTTNFDQRKKQHKGHCNNSKSKAYNLNVYKFIREHGGWENFDMVLIEYYPCETKLELEREERKVLEQQDLTLNMRVPSRSQKEYVINNKEKIKQYQYKYRNEYRENNKEKRKESAKNIMKIIRKK